MEPVRWEQVAAERIGEAVERQVVWGEKGTLARFRFARGAHVAAHRHPAEQFTCLVEGAMRVRLEGRDVKLAPGDILVIPAGVEHEVWFSEESVVVDFFAPAREDWRAGEAAYLKG